MDKCTKLHNDIKLNHEKQFHIRLPLTSISHENPNTVVMYMIGPQAGSNATIPLDHPYAALAEVAIGPQVFQFQA